MARAPRAGNDDGSGRRKMKTGCITCRFRKIKCDEEKPFCFRCVTTGRKCDGYESTFRFASTSMEGSLAVIRSTRPHISPQEVDLLNRFFSTKTMCNITLDCDQEAREALQAGLANPPIRHAIQSLRALRRELEVSGNAPRSVLQHTPGYRYGLQQYGMALGGLASNLASPSSNGPNSALLCCQILISVEQVRDDYAAMAQHIIRGLKIIHESRARRYLVGTNELDPAYHKQLPMLDVFIIKLFAAPCRFADSPTAANESKKSSSMCSLLEHKRPITSGEFRPLACDLRTALTKVAQSTIVLLNKMSRTKSEALARQLLSEKAVLLNVIESWLVDLDANQAEVGISGHEPISRSFMRLFHSVLRVVLLGTLDPSPDLDLELQIEHSRLQGIANSVSEQVRDYRTQSVLAHGT